MSLVSVIACSMDRRTLHNALNSIASHTYPDIEVILINALGNGHRGYGELIGKFPLQSAW